MEILYLCGFFIFMIIQALLDWQQKFAVFLTIIYFNHVRLNRRIYNTTYDPIFILASYLLFYGFVLLQLFNIVWVRYIKHTMFGQFIINMEHSYQNVKSELIKSIVFSNMNSVIGSMNGNNIDIGSMMSNPLFANILRPNVNNIRPPVVVQTRQTVIQGDGDETDTSDNE